MLVIIIMATEIESIILSDGIPISNFLFFSISSVIDMIVDIILLKYTFIKIPKCCSTINKTQSIGYNLPIVLDITFGVVHKLYVFSLHYRRFTIPKESIFVRMISAEILKKLINTILTVSALFIIWFEFPSSLQFPFIIAVLKCFVDMLFVVFKGYIGLLPFELLQFILTVIILVAAPRGAIYSDKWFTRYTKKGYLIHSCDDLQVDQYSYIFYNSISVNGGILKEYCNDDSFINGGPCCDFYIPY